MFYCCHSVSLLHNPTVQLAARSDIHINCKKTVGTVELTCQSLTIIIWLNCVEKFDWFTSTGLWFPRLELFFLYSSMCGMSADFFKCGVFAFCFSSTIHGRIDQVNQLLELDYQKRGGARYTALDKWTNQLNTLNQAIVSKLTWWHVKSRDKENGMF